jgi:hypothetical protein
MNRKDAETQRFDNANFSNIFIKIMCKIKF